MRSYRLNAVCLEGIESLLVWLHNSVASYIRVTGVVSLARLFSWLRSGPGVTHLGRSGPLTFWLCGLNLHSGGNSWFSSFEWPSYCIHICLSVFDYYGLPGSTSVKHLDGIYKLGSRRWQEWNAHNYYSATFRRFLPLFLLPFCLPATVLPRCV